MGDIGYLSGITHHNDVGRAFEELRQNVEVVACQILHLIHENKGIDTGKPLDDSARRLRMNAMANFPYLKNSCHQPNT